MIQTLSIIALASDAVLAMAYPVQAREVTWEPTSEMRCTFSGWQNARVGGPTRVRTKPSAKGRVVGALPAGTETRDYSITFDILATRLGWVQIAHASDQDNEGNGYAKRAFYKGQGWIPADAARVAVQSARGYSRPDATSTRVLDLGSEWLSDAADIEAVLGCSGEWILLAYRMRGAEEKQIPRDQQRTAKAWFRGVCGIEETTCDMKSVDND